MIVREISVEEFESYIRTVDSSLYQTKEYAYTMQKQNYDILFVGGFEGFNIVAASLILIEKKSGFKYAYSPRGFVLDYNNSELIKNFTDGLKKLLSKKDITAIKLCPPIKRTDENYEIIYNDLMKLGYWHFGYNVYFEALKPRFEAVLNLDKPYYELFNAIKKEYRTKIRSASRTGVSIIKGTSEDLEILYSHTKKKYIRDLKYFKDIYSEFSENKKVEFYYAKLDTKKHLDFVKNSYEALEKENNSINEKIIDVKVVNNHSMITKKIDSDTKFDKIKRDLIVSTNLSSNYPDGIILASALIVKNKKEVYLLMDGYDKNYSSLNGKHLLLWKLIEKYSGSQFTKFNFGGITGPDDKEKFKGLNDFKLNFGSSVEEYIGDLELIINQTKYFMMKKALPIASILKK